MGQKRRESRRVGPAREYDNNVLRELWVAGDWNALAPAVHEAVALGAWRIVASASDAGDILKDIQQDVFIRCVNTETVPDSPFRFVMIAARNRAMDVVRKAPDMRDRAFGVNVHDDLFIAEVAYSTEPDQDLDGDAIRGSFMAALRTLPAWGQEILRLRIRDGLSYGEIERRHGISVGRAKMRQLRAVRMMREAWSVPPEYVRGRPHFTEKRFSPYAAAA